MIRIDKWAGLVTNASPYAIPSGATVEQVNVQCLSPGKLTVRPGTTTVAMPVSGGGQKIVRAFRYQHGSGEHIVYQEADGSIYSSVVQASAEGNRVTPSEPKINSVLSGNKSLTVNLEAPSTTGNSPVTGYTIQVSSNAGSSWTPAGTTTQTTYVVAALVNDTPYLVRAAASNAFGTGPFSEAFGPVSPTGPVLSIPSPPLDVKGTPSLAKALLSWTKPDFDGNTEITSYSVQLSSDRGVTWTLAGTATETTFEVSGLKNKTDYIFRVSASNAIGSSEWSAASPSVTINYVVSVPGAPQSLSLSLGVTTADLTWQAPVSSGSSPVIGYMIVWKSSAGGRVLGTATTSNTSYQITGLTLKTYVYIEVAATNDSANYGMAATAFGTTLASIAVPSAPRKLPSTALLGGAVFRWDAPLTDGGSAVAHYLLYYPTTTSTPLTLPSTTREYTISGLTPGATIAFDLSAVNAAGESVKLQMRGAAGDVPLAFNLAIGRTVPLALTFTVTPPTQIPLAGGGYKAVTDGGTSGMAILAYEFTPVNPQAGDSSDTVVVTGGNSYTFTNLSSSRSYSWSVRVRTELGLGAARISAATVPLASPAFAPLAPVITERPSSVSHSKTFDSYQPSTYTGQAITSGQADYTLDGGITWTRASDSRITNVTSPTVIGYRLSVGPTFPANKQYLVSVRARMSNALSGQPANWGPYATFGPVSMQPSAPSPLSSAWRVANVYPYQLGVFPGVENGRPILGYYLYITGMARITLGVDNLVLPGTVTATALTKAWTLSAYNDVGESTTISVSQP